MILMPRALPRQITGPVVAVLAKVGVTPNMLTIAQLVGGIIAGAIIGSGELLIGGIVLILSAALDDDSGINYWLLVPAGIGFLAMWYFGRRWAERHQSGRRPAKRATKRRRAK